MIYFVKLAPRIIWINPFELKFSLLIPKYIYYILSIISVFYSSIYY